MGVERTWAVQEPLSGQQWKALCCALMCVLALAVACRSEPTATPTPVPTPTPALADAESVARDYLRAWQDGAYDRMYTWLSPSAMASTPADKFVSRYKAIAEEASITAVTASVTGIQRKLTDAAVVSFTLTVDTRLAGQFRVENALDLTFIGQRWTVEWAPKAIFPLLLRDNLVHMFIRPPSRGSILDRKDRPLAAEGQVIEVGVVTGQIKDEAQHAARAVRGIDSGQVSRCGPPGLVHAGW
jgi:hypothetical protein